MYTITATYVLNRKHARDKRHHGTNSKSDHDTDWCGGLWTNVRQKLEREKRAHEHVYSNMFLDNALARFKAPDVDGINVVVKFGNNLSTVAGSGGNQRCRNKHEGSGNKVNINRTDHACIQSRAHQ